MCVPLAIAAAGVAAAGEVTGGISSLMQGNYAASVAKQNAAMEIDAAHDAVTQGQIAARQFYRQVGTVKGDQVAAMAANGVDVGYGSAERLQEDTAQGAADDAKNLYYNTDQKIKSAYVDATNYVEQAKAAKFQGRQALIGSLFKGASSLMGGFGQQARISAGQGGGGQPLGNSYIQGNFGAIG